MAKYLYEVSIVKGKNNKFFHKFLTNVADLNGKSPDYGGISNVCVISHHMDAKTIHGLCTDGFKTGNESDVTVEEITKATLKKPSSHHRVYTELIQNYFLPHGSYPNL
jgi:hypothetical protein